MTEEISRKKKLFALIGMALGFILFIAHLFRGMDIDPRLDMHGRMVSYTVAMFGLTLAFACQWALAEKTAQKVVGALVTIAALAVAIYQMTKIF